MPHASSRWWYALVPFPVLVAARYGLLGLTALLLPTAGPSRTAALPVLVLGLAASLAGALVVATAPLFVVGLVLDIRALRRRSAWTPSPGYGALGVIPVVGLYTNWVALLSIPATVAYLVIRRRQVGSPLGDRRETDAVSAAGTSRRSPSVPTPRWRYGVVAPPALEVTGWTMLWAMRSTGVLRGGSDPLTLLVPAGMVLVAVGLVPVFALSLYRDAQTVSDASAESSPDPRIWGLLGVASLVSVAVFRLTLMPLVALAYGVRRSVRDGS